MVNEDICLVCNDGGDLICCDRCPAAYHMECIPDERKPIDDDPDSLKPSSKWLCPRHFCVECNIGEEELLEGGALQGSRYCILLFCSLFSYSQFCLCVQTEPRSPFHLPMLMQKEFKFSNQEMENWE